MTVFIEIDKMLHLFQQFKFRVIISYIHIHKGI